MPNGLSKEELIKMSAHMILVSKQLNNHSLNIKKYCTGKIFSSGYTGNSLIGVVL